MAAEGLPYPLPRDEQVRLQALYRYDLGHLRAGEAFGHVTRLAHRVFDVPIVLVSLIYEDTQRVMASLGWEIKEIPRHASLDTHVLLADEVMVVEDAAADARFKNNPFVLGQPRIRFYAGAPLKTPEGLAIGTLSLMDSKPRRFAAEPRQVLADLAALASDELALRQQTGTAQESQQRFQMLVEAMGDWAWESDTSRIIRYSSPGVRNVLGYEPAHVLGRALYDFLTPTDAERIRTDEEVQRKIASGEPYQLRLTFLHRSGAEVVAQVQGRPIRDPEGNVWGYWGLAHDVTGRELTEEALSLAVARAEQMSSAQLRFLSTVSHELITPLTVIEVQAKTLREQAAQVEGPVAEEMREAVMFVEEALGQIREMVDSVHDSRRVEEEAAALEREAVEPLAVVQALTERLRSGVGARHRFRVGGHRFTMRTDAKLLHMILSNLVTNALKYSPPDTDVEVTVVKEENEAHFRVRDYGIGIPAEALPRLFEPFFRAGNAGAVYGTGLGLAIVRQAVERLGGRVAVQSKVGAGTVFHVWLPVGNGEEVS